MKKLLVVSLALLLILAYAVPSFAAGDRVKVAVSIFPIADIVKQVGKDNVTVAILLPPSASEHTFEPTPKQMMELRDARVFIKVGAGLEAWAEGVVRAVANKDLIQVDLSKGMPLIYGVHEHEGAAVRDSSGRSADPHFWLDPVLAKRIVDKVADALKQADPRNRDFYAANAVKYKADLDALNRGIALKISRFRVKEYVTFHAAWNYFSKRYGLKVIGVIEEAPGREPSPAHIAELVKGLKKLNTRVVFAEPQFNPRIAEAIAREAGAKVLFLDPLGAPNAPDKDSYIRLMRYNVDQMRKAME